MDNQTKEEKLWKEVQDQLQTEDKSSSDQELEEAATEFFGE